jgi:uncharacterized protein with PIN domain
MSENIKKLVITCMDCKSDLIGLERKEITEEIISQYNEMVKCDVPGHIRLSSSVIEVKKK